MEESYTVTETELAEAFNEWKRRRLAEPEEFIAFDQEVPPLPYGEHCAKYLLEILFERG